MLDNRVRVVIWSNLKSFVEKSFSMWNGLYYGFVITLQIWL